MINIPPRELFEEWLRSKPEDEVIADKWSCCSCPIAAWLKDTDVYEYPMIYPNDISHPQWAREFIEKIDDYNGVLPTTSLHCLNVLTSISK